MIRGLVFSSLATTGLAFGQTNNRQAMDTPNQFFILFYRSGITDNGKWHTRVILIIPSTTACPYLLVKSRLQS